MAKLNMRGTAVTWINNANKPLKLAVHSPGTGNFPSKLTVTSEKLHTPEVWSHGRG